MSWKMFLKCHTWKIDDKYVMEVDNMSYWAFVLFKFPDCFPRPAEFSDLLPEDMIPKNYLTFGHVVPVSASTGFGVDHLKSCIRESLDEDATTETKAIHHDRLQALRHRSQV